MMKKLENKSWLVTITLVFALCLLSYSITLASLTGKSLNIPFQYGTIKESFDAQQTTQDTNRMVIHIQDAHCNYQAQKNMAQLLDYLVKGYNLKLIMVEGGSGDVSLSFLRGYADKKAREEVADKYLRDGKISGEEYLDIVSDYNLELYGIEDEALYDSHMDSFRKIDSIKEEGLRFVESLSNNVKQLKPLIYSEELMLLEKKKSGYEDKTITLAEYCQYLKEMAQKKRLGLKEYPQLSAFSETARLEKEIDFKQAESQRDAFIKDLAKLLDERGVQNLILMTQGFKAKMITAGEYYSFLKATGEQKLDLRRNYPLLNSYINYLALSKDINAGGLLKEISAIEVKIKEASFTNTDQRRLAEISKSLQILTKVLNLELTPEDYAYFQANKAKFLTAPWKEFLSQKCSSYNLSFQPFASTVIDENLNELDNFYQLGTTREEAFIKNLEAKLNESGEKLVVLITGGFHTPGVTRMLKEKSYSYAVVAPVITQKSDPELYFSVLRGEKKQSDEALNEGE